MRKLWSAVPVFAFVVALAACSSQQPAAEAALKTAQDAYNAVSADAQKYVPDQARSVQSALSSAQDQITKGDYAAALTTAQGIPAQVTALSAAISAKKTEMMTAWNTMSSGVPKLVTALTSRVSTLAQSKSLPAGITKATVTNAQGGLATVNQMWTDATNAATSGDLATAMAKANDVKSRVVGMMQSLHMTIPPGAGGL